MCSHSKQKLLPTIRMVLGGHDDDDDTAYNFQSLHRSNMLNVFNTYGNNPVKNKNIFF